MKKIVSLQVNIPHPCTERWENLPVMEDGRFCGQCSKKVIDFSYMSDEEVVRTMEKYEDDLCGRYREDQLNRELVVGKERNHSLAPAIMLSTMLTAGATTAGSSDAKGASTEMVQSDTTIIPPCSAKDTTENLLAGYSALGRDFEVKSYPITTTRGMVANVYSTPIRMFKAEKKRKWYQFWKRR